MTATPPTVTFKGKRITVSPVGNETYLAVTKRVCRWTDSPPPQFGEAIFEILGMIAVMGADTEAALLAMTDEQLSTAVREYCRSMGLDDLDAMTRYLAALVF
jgi:hypothetical protein